MTADRASGHAKQIARHLDMLDLGTRDFEADSFYFDRAIDIIARERGNGPLFLYVYTVANHFSLGHAAASRTDAGLA